MPRVLPAILLLLALVACATDRPAAHHPPTEPATAPAAPQPAAELPEEWNRLLPVEARVFHEDDEFPWTHYPMRVIDDVTGEPVAGARIEAWSEAQFPGAEPWDWSVDVVSTTDHDGWGLNSRYGSWLFVEAPGYAPLAEFGVVQDERRLRRGEDAHVEVLDWRGRPLADATLEYMLGCGHTPTVREAITDQHGRAVFPCYGGDEGSVWLRAAGHRGRNPAYGWMRDLPRRADGTFVVHAWPAPDSRGRVTDALGNPVAGAVVGQNDAHRGPWTLSDESGEFALIGAEPDASFVVRAPFGQGWDTADGVVEVWRSPSRGVFHQIVLPPRFGSGEVAFTEPRDTVRIQVTVAPEAVVPDAAVRFHEVRLADGLAEAWGEAIEGESFVVEVTVPHGEWTISAGSPGGPIRSVSTTVVLGAGGADAALHLAPNPQWSPRVVQEFADGSTVPVTDLSGRSLWISTSHGRKRAVSVETTADEDTDGATAVERFYVPASGPFVVELESGDRSARAVVADVAAGSIPTLVLPFVPVDAEVEESADDPSIERSGMLTVRLPDGRPAAEAYVVVDDDARWRSDDLDANGQQQYTLHGRARLEIAPEDEDGFVYPDRIVHIDGPGPWEVTWPDTTVVVRAVDESGAPLEFFKLSLGGNSFSEYGYDGVLTLRGFPPGPLRIWVGSEGRRGRDIRVIVSDDEPREVVAVLPLRPAVPTEAQQSDE